MTMLVLLVAAASPALRPASPCLPGDLELRRRPGATASALSRPLGRMDLTPTPEQLKASRANPPPAFGGLLEPCDPNARVQRDVVPAGSGARP